MTSRIGFCRNFNYGFTLAEILITLGVIGVVAALTIPALIAKHQKQVFITKLKYSYNIIYNAYTKAVEDNGPVSDWDIGTNKTSDELYTEETNNKQKNEAKYIAETYFLPYIQTSKINDQNANSYGFVTANGISMNISTDGTINSEGTYTPTAIYVRVFFAPNKPIDYSKNTAIIVIHKTRQQKPYFFYWNDTGTRDGIKNNPHYGCNKNQIPSKRNNCAALIYYDGWQIKDDYPW